jgi:hypothetical protein
LESNGGSSKKGVDGWSARSGAASAAGASAGEAVFGRAGSSDSASEPKMGGDTADAHAWPSHQRSALGSSGSRYQPGTVGILTFRPLPRRCYLAGTVTNLRAYVESPSPSQAALVNCNDRAKTCDGTYCPAMHMTRLRGAVRHAAFAVVPIVVAVVVACSSSPDETDAAEEPTTTTEPEDLVMQSDDFGNIHDMTPVRGFFIDNPLGHLDEAIAVANNPEGGEYPVGTIIQLVPSEAMVKRAPGFDPQSNDWELFSLEVTAEGTTILARGGAEVVNQFGGSCVECHSQARPEFDFVCEDDHGCAPLPIGDDVIQAVQDADPRPRRQN